MGKIVSVKLSSEQYKTVSEILGNISVAWFTAGIVSPLFFTQGQLSRLVLYLVTGLSMFGFFVIASLYFSGKIIRQ